MAKSTITFRLNGQDIPAPRNWKDIKILATFDNDTNQATVTTDRWEFVNESATLVSDHFKSGRNGNGVGAFEGPNFDIFISDEEGAIKAFEGLLNLVEDYEELNFKGDNFTDPLEVRASAEMKNSLNGVDSQIAGITVAYLESQGVYSQSDYVDCPFVVEKKFDFIEFVIVSFAIYSMVKEAAEAIEKLGEDISVFSGIGSSSLTGTIGAVIFQVLVVIFRLAYIALIIVQLINLVEQLITFFISPLRTHKVISLYTLLNNAFEYFGYKFVSPIEELKNYHYLPTIPLGDGGLVNDILNKVKVSKTGLPSTGDFGYLFSECIELCINLFYARIAVVDGANGREVHLRTDDDEWWIKRSTLDVIDDVLIDNIKYNTDELNRSIFIKYQTDPIDEFTTDNYTGTSIDVNVSPKAVQNIENVRISGIDEVSIPLALGNTKQRLTRLEDLILSFAGIAEAAINTLGGNKDFKSKIKNRVNILKVSNPEHSVAKLLYMEGSSIPANHRDLISAEYLYDNFHNAKSFIENNFRRQRLRFENIKVPFNFKDFKELSENPYFITQNGVQGKFERLEWTIDGDYAEASGWIRSLYTKNLVETKNIA